MDSENNEPYTSSILCQINSGCMGCCGNNFQSNRSVRRAIHKNTMEFKYARAKTEEDYIKFRDRAGSRDLRFGVCRNLISVEKEDGSLQYLCPLHPTLHSGKDLRVDHCNIHYLCKTAKAFGSWDKEMQEMFLDFVKRKEFDNLDFSLWMANSKLLDEFELQFKREDY